MPKREKKFMPFFEPGRRNGQPLDRACDKEKGTYSLPIKVEKRKNARSRPSPPAMNDIFRERQRGVGEK